MKGRRGTARQGLSGFHPRFCAPTNTAGCSTRPSPLAGDSSTAEPSSRDARGDATARGTCRVDAEPQATVIGKNDGGAINGARPSPARRSFDGRPCRMDYGPRQRHGNATLCKGGRSDDHSDERTRRAEHHQPISTTRRGGSSSRRKAIQPDIAVVPPKEQQGRRAAAQAARPSASAP